MRKFGVTAAEMKWVYETFTDELKMTKQGAIGLMCNLDAESDGFYPNRVEYLCRQRLREAGKYNWNNDDFNKMYTEYVDTGKISKTEFMNPLPGKQYGFALAQWTTPSRKSGLYDTAKKMRKSIGSIEVSIAYLEQELLTTYKNVLTYLQTATSGRAACAVVLRKFECPSDQSEAMVDSRWARHVDIEEYIASSSTASKKEEIMATKITDPCTSLLKIAESEIGYLEKKSSSQLDNKTANAGSNNYTKYWRDLATWGLGNYQAQYWCAAFVHWCFVKTFGLSMAKKLLLHAPFIYCPTLASLGTNNKQLYTKPKKYDVVLFWNGREFSHTGLVVGVSGNKITTIEGNTSGASSVISNGGGVCKKTYTYTSLNGVRFFRPNYSLVGHVASETTPTNSVKTTGGTYMFEVGTVKNGSKGNDVKLLQRLLKSNGCKDSTGNKLTIDGDCGAKTVAAIKQFQKANSLTVDGVCGPKTWKAILLR